MDDQCSAAVSMVDPDDHDFEKMIQQAITQSLQQCDSETVKIDAAIQESLRIQPTQHEQNLQKDIQRAILERNQAELASYQLATTMQASFDQEQREQANALEDKSLKIVQECIQQDLRQLASVERKRKLQDYAHQYQTALYNPNAGHTSANVNGNSPPVVDPKVSYATVVGNVHVGQYKIRPTIGSHPANNAMGSCPSYMTSASRRAFIKREKLQLVVDGANVAHRYDGSGFNARGIRYCVDFWISYGIPAKALVVTLSESRRDDSDAELLQLERRGLLAWTPTGKDDDLFTIQTALEQGAWIVSNDRYLNHRRWTAPLSKKILKFAFAREVFVVAPDDLLMFQNSRVNR